MATFNEVWCKIGADLPEQYWVQRSMDNIIVSNPSRDGGFLITKEEMLDNVWEDKFQQHLKDLAEWKSSNYTCESQKGVL